MMSPTRNPLFREIGRRVMVSFWLKSLGIPAFMAAFFLGYFLILNFPVFQVSVMPLTLIDGWIPYHTGAWTLYVSLWIYVQLPPTLIDTKRELVLYGCSAAAVSVAGFAIFLLWPTAVPAMEINAGGTLAGIRGLDTTGNSCPSLHVAFSVFTAVWLELFLRRAKRSAAARGLNMLWCLAIIYSTLGTKQHVFLDAIPGSVLGLAGGLLQARFMQKWGVSPRGESLPILTQINPAARKL